ncbi:unnamed protein product [Rhizoctonia solani]|uniref:Protein kinase domain-containing protein n=1 Tax=Rhizoctonia solani TaxID=456999 RepID=A0A8H2XM77_9AGAM|nr:unnamed protein product [Rhizoctonia solani]
MNPRRLEIIWQETEKHWKEKHGSEFPRSRDAAFRQKIEDDTGIEDDSPSDSEWRDLWRLVDDCWMESESHLQEENTRRRVDSWARGGSYHENNASDPILVGRVLSPEDEGSGDDLISVLTWRNGEFVRVMRHYIKQRHRPQNPPPSRNVPRRRRYNSSYSRRFNASSGSSRGQGCSSRSGGATSVATIADELPVTDTRVRVVNSPVLTSDEISSLSDISSFTNDEAGPSHVPLANTPNTEQDILPSKDTPVSKAMTAAEVVSYLVTRGCPNRMGDLDPTSFSEHPIFHGGFSDIYSGRLLNNSQVAIKALRISIGNINQGAKHIKHAARELHTWSKCRHPNVLPLLGLVEFRGGIGMISPWMAQGSLPRYLTNNLGVNRCHMCLQICDGLSYLHHIGIIHGDLKGTNVLVSDSGIPVLTDFGNSVLRNQTLKFTQTTSGASLTVRWSAAELITESGPPNEATDVYALGMTMYEVMAGTIPYEGKKEARIIYLVVEKKEPPERPKSIPGDCKDGEKLWNLLVRCWSFESSSRPSAKEVKKIMQTITPEGLALATPTTNREGNWVLLIIRGLWKWLIGWKIRRNRKQPQLHQV